MSFDRIIALDLGKFNSVAAFATTPMALHDFFVARIEAGDEPARTLVVFESCDVAGSDPGAKAVDVKRMRGMTSINQLRDPV